MKRKLLVILCCMLASVLLFSACGTVDGHETAGPETSHATEQATESEQQSSETEETPQSTLRFAYLVKNLTNPYFIEQANGVKDTCAKYGIEVEVQATEKETDIDKQLQIADNYLTQQFDAIIVAPLSSTAIVPFIKRCNEAGVPFINIDTRADVAEMEKLGAKSVTYVGSNNYTAGVASAEGLIEALGGQGKIAVLEGTPGAQSAEDRKQGFNDTIAGTGIEVVTSQPANYNRNTGYTVFQSMLSANPDIVGLFAANDEMALGAIKAIEEAGMTGKIQVVGINFVQDAQDAIKAGALYGSVSQQPYQMGVLAVEKALDYLNAVAVEEEYITDSILMTIDDVE